MNTTETLLGQQGRVGQLEVVALREDVTRVPGPLQVDRDKGIIYSVKILGWESDNGRRYLPEAGQKAVPLYEGSKVFLDHPEKRQATRDDDDAFGRLHNVHWEEDGVYGDLHFFKSHPMAARVCEDVERGLGVFGMSHNAQGEGETVDGVFVIQRIVEVRSVDLVSEPATVKNLWESKMASRRERIRAILESRHLTSNQRHFLRRLASTAPDQDQEPTHRDHLLDAVGSCLKEDMDPHERCHKVNRIMELLNPEPGSMPHLEEDDEEEGARPDDDSTDADADATREGRGRWSGEPGVRELQDELAFLRLDKTIHRLCEAKRVPCTAELLEALHALKEEGKIARHLDYLKRLSVPGRKRSRKLERQTVQESLSAAVPSNVKSRLQWLMN
jgi:hypothetical protein